MARPCYVYLQLKMSGYKGTITVHGNMKIALEYEEGNVGDPPQRQEPYPLPVLVDEVDGLVNLFLHWAPVTGRNHCLGEAG